MEAYQDHPEPRDEVRPADAVPCVVLVRTCEVRRGANRLVGDGLGDGPQAHGRRNVGRVECAAFRREGGANLVSEFFVNVTAKCCGGPGSGSGSARVSHHG